MTTPTIPTKHPVGTAPQGVPGARNFDHAGVAVPDLDEAVRFFTDVLGAELLFRAGPYQTMEQKVDADPGTTVRVAMLRFGPNANLELLEFDGPQKAKQPPRVSDNGAHHVAIWVENVWRAADYLRQQPGVTILGEPGSTPAGPESGVTWVYAKADWGLYIECVHRPDHLPYEQDTPARIYGPASAWSEPTR